VQRNINGQGFLFCSRRGLGLESLEKLCQEVYGSAETMVLESLVTNKVSSPPGTPETILRVTYFPDIFFFLQLEQKFSVVGGKLTGPSGTCGS